MNFNIKNKGMKMSVRTMTLASIMTALVIVFALLGQFINLGFCNVSLALVPIVIGAATCGVYVGAWLGLVNGLVILFSGQATFFMGVSAFGTILVVILKGSLCGFTAGLVYHLINKVNLIKKLKLDGKWKIKAKHNEIVAVVAASAVCPIVNTLIFVLGCFTFFLPAMQAGAEAGGTSTFAYVLTVMVGFNFFVELAVNLILAPTVSRLLEIKRKI